MDLFVLVMSTIGLGSEPRFYELLIHELTRIGFAARPRFAFMIET